MGTVPHGRNTGWFIVLRVLAAHCLYQLPRYVKVVVLAVRSDASQLGGAGDADFGQGALNFLRQGLHRCGPLPLVRQ